MVGGHRKLFMKRLLKWNVTYAVFLGLAESHEADQEEPEEYGFKKKTFVLIHRY